MAGNETLAEEILCRYKQLTQKRTAVRGICNTLSKYFFMRPMMFGDVATANRGPRFSMKDVADDDAVEAARTSATALGGALWPHAGESFEFVPIEPMITAYDAKAEFKSQDVSDYAQQITKMIRSDFDSPETAYLLSLDEHLNDQVVIGTSGIYGEELSNDEQPVRFRSVTIETAVIDEGPDGLIDTVYFEYLFTVRQIVQKYELKNVSPAVRDAYKGKHYDDYIKVIQAIEPRSGGKVGAPKRKKPFASVHMEVESKHVIKHDGMDELPAWIVRFRKRPNELYGRSLGMDALPSVKELNVLRTAFSLNLHKQIRPPLGYYPEAIGAGGSINDSAGAFTPFHSSNRIPQGQKPIEKLYDIPEPRVANDRLSELSEKTRSKFLVDRLLDFNNKTRMTKGEADYRYDFRNQALGSIFNRQITELIVPAIKWVFKVRWRRGLLGLDPTDQKQAAMIEDLRANGITPLVIPPIVSAMMKQGKFPFAIRLISPAARAMKAEQLLGLEKLTNYVIALTTAGNQDAMDVLDSDTNIRTYQELSGAPANAVRGTDKVAQERKARRAALAQQAEMQQADLMAGAAAKGAKAAKDFSQLGAA